MLRSIVRCAGAIALFVSLVGCGYKMLDESGRMIGNKKGGPVIDFGHYRITLSEVYAARAYSIPHTMDFHFQWSPSGVRAIHKRLGYRKAKEADWQAYRRYLDVLSHKNPAVLTQDRKDNMVALLRNSAAGEFEYVAFPDAQIGSCRQPIGKWCKGSRLSLSRTRLEALSREVLKQAMPYCRLVRFNPEEVVRLATSGQKPSAIRIYGEVACD